MDPMIRWMCAVEFGVLSKQHVKVEIDISPFAYDGTLCSAIIFMGVALYSVFRGVFLNISKRWHSNRFAWKAIK